MNREERYEILETVQDGQLAVSYKARDRELDRLVLLKVLHPGMARDAELVKRFRREARLQARLRHKGIVTVYDFGSEEDFFIASEFIEGIALDRLLKMKGRFKPDALVPVILDVVSALSYAHSQDVVHRDLKPANIMVTSVQPPEFDLADAEAKLTDFGLALCRDLGQLTQEGCIIGTPAYMSPEQARGRATDARTDVFSLGVVIYEALTGTNPFRAETAVDSMSLVLNREPRPLRQIDSTLPPELASLVGRMMDKNPENRPADLAEVAAVFGAGRSRTARPLSRLVASLLPPSAVLLATAVAAGFILDLRPATDRPEPRPEVILPAVAETTLLAPEVPVPETAASPAPQRTEEPAATTPAVKRQCMVRISVTPWAEVLVDGQRVGTTPLSERLELPCGKHVFSFRNPYFPVLTKDVTLDDSSATLAIDLEKEFALVEIRVRPWAVLTIDGELVDTTPMDRPVPLSPGEHTVVLFHPELGTRIETVRTDTAGPYRFVFDITNGGR